MPIIVCHRSHPRALSYRWSLISGYEQIVIQKTHVYSTAALKKGDRVRN